MDDAACNARPAGRWRGRLLVLSAAVLWSTSGLFVKSPAFDAWPAEWRPTVLAFWRAAFACLLLAPLVRRVRWSWRLIPMLASFIGMNWAFMSAMVWTEASLAIFLQYTAPLWVFLGGVLVLGEHVRRADWIFLCLAITGIAVIIIPQIGGVDQRGLMYGLIAGVFFAGVMLSLRNLRDFDAAFLVLLNHVATALVMFPWAMASGLMPSGVQWAYLAGFGILQMGLPYLLFARGVQSVSGPEASTIALLEPVLVPVWVFLVWRYSADYQAPVVTTMIGGALIVVGLMMRYGFFNRLVRPKS